MSSFSSGRTRPSARFAAASLAAAALIAGPLVGTTAAVASAPAHTRSTPPGPTTRGTATGGPTTPDDTLPYAPAKTPAAPAGAAAGPLTLLRGSTTATTAPLAAASPSTTVHTLDVVLADPTGVTHSATTADVDSLVADVSSYWSAQTDGRVSFTVRSIHTVTTSATCSTSAGLTKMWTEASEAVAGKDWWASGDPKVGPPARDHLVVLYPYASNDRDGATTCGGTMGLGTISSKASVGDNGLTFALFGGRTKSTSARTSDPQFYTARQTLAHELGHNFGLEHSGTWWCDSGPSDGSFSSSACGMISYFDPFDPMGASFADHGVPALSGPQKLRLGALSSGRHRTLAATGTTSLTVAADPASEVGAPAGVQLAQVKDPITGDTYDVEYRPSLAGATFPGPDGSPLGTYEGVDGFGRYRLSSGVRILRLAPRTTSAWDKNEQSIVPIGPATSRTSYLPVGHSFTTRSKAVTVTVRSASSASGRASVAFTIRHTPSLSLHRSRTTQRHAQTAARVTATVGSVGGKHSTGTVRFKDGSKTLKTVRTTSSGVAAYTLPRSLSVRKHTITAAYAPDAASTTRALARSATTHVTVRKATSSLTVKLAHRTVKKRAKPKATIRVHVAGVTHPTGTLKVYENGHKVRTLKLRSSKKGKVTVTLPRTTKRGHIKVVAKYSGTASIGARTSKRVTLTVR